MVPFQFSKPSIDWAGANNRRLHKILMGNELVVNGLSKCFSIKFVSLKKIVYYNPLP